MKIAEVMTRDVRVIQPDRSVRDAARLMDEMNVGVLPVCDGRRLVGMLTDRDIAVRSTAAGIAPDRHRVHDVMSASLQWCFEDDDAEDVLRHMSDKQIRRMPVVDSERRLVGIVALGDLATDGAAGIEEALKRISSPSEPDRSGTPSQARADRTRERAEEMLTPEERHELERRRESERAGGFGRGASDVGPPRGDLQDFPRGYTRHGERRPSDEEVRRAAYGSGEGWRERRSGGFRFRDEDHRRAAFPGGFNRGYGEGEAPGRMPGGYGGEGYRNYGGVGAWGAQGRGAQGGGGPRYDAISGHGSRRSGMPRRLGTEGEENYDRGIRSSGEGLPPMGGTRFSNETAGYGMHRGRGPKGYTRSDERLREEVCERLTDDPRVDAAEIEVEVKDREVTLSGAVRDRDQKRFAEDIAMATLGVNHVQNNLRVGAQAAGVRTGGGGTVSGGTPEPVSTTDNPGTSGGPAGTTVR